MTRSIDRLTKFDARPGQSLAAHLDGVAMNMSCLFADSGTNAYGDEWQEIGKVLAWTHDAGKLTTYFQDYLRTQDRSLSPTVKHTYHGFVSALLTTHVLYELDMAEGTQQSGFYAVAKHHGVIPNIPEERNDYDITTGRRRTEQRFDVVGDQLSNIDAHAAEAADTLLRTASNGAIEWSDILVNRPHEYSQLITGFGSPDQNLYETILRAWSTLVCGDKLDASNIQVPKSSKRPSLQKLRTHVAGLPDGKTSQTQRLNYLRSTAHEETIETFREAYNGDNRLFRITLPTGFGKTLTGLRAALEVAEDIDGRVIYSLPYTSIIDQIHAEITDIFEINSGDPEYTIHHHLADTWTRLNEINDREQVSDGSESLYAETWQSGIVLTTFVQLFESLAGPGNVQSMKLPALQDSIIIVDEPQALALEWWALVGRLAKSLHEEYNASLILMTATQPEIFERDPDLPDPISLTTQFQACQSYIQDNPRVDFRLHTSLQNYLDTPDAPPCTFSKAADQIVSSGLRSGTQTTLAITNTVKSAATLSESVATTIDSHEGKSLHLADKLLDFYQMEDIGPRCDAAEFAKQYLDMLASEALPKPTSLVATLTAQLRPTDRALLLEAIRLRLDSDTSTPFDDVPLITISTQLIEAGVDISFDQLYRDFAPIPALVQAAGRCNRNFGGDLGPVTIWRLEGVEDSIPSELIYGSRSLLRPTRHALQDLQTDGASTNIPEATMISDGVTYYYDYLHDQLRTDSRRSDLVEYFDSARGASLREVSLIEEHTDTHDVAILVSDSDRETYRTYHNARDEGAWQQAEDALNSLKHLFVSVPVEKFDVEPSSAFTPVDFNEETLHYAICTGRGFSPD